MTLSSFQDPQSVESYTVRGLQLVQFVFVLNRSVKQQPQSPISLLWHFICDFSQCCEGWAAAAAGSGGGPYVKLQTIIDPGDILQHLTFTLAGRDMKSLIECVLLCSSLVTSLINSPPSSLSLGAKLPRLSLAWKSSCLDGFGGLIHCSWTFHR